VFRFLLLKGTPKGNFSEYNIDMIAISVSTNYEDLLAIILPQNYKFFDRWYIITRPDDEKTIEVVTTANYPNVELLYFDFFASIQPSGMKPTFNKGGAIRMCQQKLIAEGYTGPVLLLDSDIYLPDDFMSIITPITIEDNALYGTSQRYDYHSKEKFLARTPDDTYHGGREHHGFFQLYKQSPRLLYNDSVNCSICDIKFIYHFSRRCIITNLCVDHLGKSGINWDMRLTHNDFSSD
jgi:hypothetical protein